MGVTPRRWRWTLVGALLVYAAGVAAMAAIALNPASESPDFSVALASNFAVSLGLLVGWRRPESPMSGALVFLVAAPTLVAALEAWGVTYGTSGQMPAASVVAAFAPGVWVFNLAGFVVLCGGPEWARDRVGRAASALGLTSPPRCSPWWSYPSSPTGEMGAHSSSFATPRLGLRNLARTALGPDATMADLGVFVANELGLSIDACMD